MDYPSHRKSLDKYWPPSREKTDIVRSDDCVCHYQREYINSNCHCNDKTKSVSRFIETPSCCQICFCPPPLRFALPPSNVAMTANQADYVPFWLDVYFIAPYYLDSKLYWNIFQLTDLERYDVQLKTLFRKKWNDIISKYENYRTVLKHELKCRVRTVQ